MITLTFKCGHVLQVDPDKTQSPACVQCGETMVARVQAPNPKFVGTVMGPLAETKHMEPVRINLAPGGPLPLKDIKEDD